MLLGEILETSNLYESLFKVEKWYVCSIGKTRFRNGEIPTCFKYLLFYVCENKKCEMRGVIPIQKVNNVQVRLMLTKGYDNNVDDGTTTEPSEIHFLVRVMKESVQPHWRDQVDVLLRDFVKEKITMSLKTRSNVLRQDFLGTKNYTEIVDLLEEISIYCCNSFYEYYNNYTDYNMEMILKFAVMCKKAKRYCETQNWREMITIEQRLLLKKIMFEILKYEIVFKNISSSESQLLKIVVELEDIFFLKICNSYSDYCDYKRLRFNMNESISYMNNNK